ncbi:MAG: hypothetical protein AB7N76_28100 [Planctomycetota bacterium]
MDPLELIPHRAPIRCLDRAVHCAADEAIAEQDLANRDGAAQDLAEQDPHLEAGQLWTGGLIEGLAQTAALLAAAPLLEGERPAEGTAPLRGVLASVRGFEVLRRPRAGETVRYTVRPLTRLGGALLIAGEAHVGEELVARGRLQLHLHPASASAPEPPAGPA